MSCAHELAVGVYAACLLRPWLMWLSFVPLSQRAWYEFLLLSVCLWQGLCPVLLPLHRSEDRASLPVSFPEGMVSCKPGRELRMSPCHVRRSMDVMLCRGVAWVVRSICEGELGESRMRMASASASLPSLQLAAYVYLCQLRGCLKVWIGIIALDGAFGVFCVALGTNAGFSVGCCCAALVCCILCVYWDSIPRAC